MKTASCNMHQSGRSKPPDECGILQNDVELLATLKFDQAEFPHRSSLVEWSLVVRQRKENQSGSANKTGPMVSELNGYYTIEIRLSSSPN